MGSEFWRGLIDWIKETMLRENKISLADLALFEIIDDPRKW